MDTRLSYSFNVRGSRRAAAYPLLLFRHIKRKVVPSVVVTHIADQLADHAQVVGYETVHHIPAQHAAQQARSEEHTSELQSRGHLVCRLLLEKKKQKQKQDDAHKQK